MSSFRTQATIGSRRSLLGFACGSLFTACLMVVGSTPSAQPATETLPSGVVARVGSRMIEAEHVLERLNEFEKTQDVANQRLRQAYSYLINLELLRAEAERLKIVVTDEERKIVADAQIDAAKQALRSRHAGQVTWETFLKGMNMTPAQFEEHVLERSEQILLKRRLIWLWEWTTPSVSFTQIVLRNEVEANLVHQRAETRLDDAKRLMNAGGVPNPGVVDQPDGGVSRVLAPAEREEAPKELRDAFWELAYLETRSRSAILQDMWEDMPLRADVQKLVFKEMKVGELSKPMRLNDETVSIYYVNSRSPGSKLSYEELKERLDAMPDPTESQYERWIQAVLHSSRHKVEFRIPGDPPHREPQAAPGAKGEPTE